MRTLSPTAGHLPPSIPEAVSVKASHARTLAKIAASPSLADFPAALAEVWLCLAFNVAVQEFFRKFQQILKIRDQTLIVNM